MTWTIPGRPRAICFERFIRPAVGRQRRPIAEHFIEGRRVNGPPGRAIAMSISPMCAASLATAGQRSPGGGPAAQFLL